MNTANNTESNTIINIRGLKKSFGENEVLKDINFSVKTGDVTCIIGSSGSGKSTLLRCVNLLEEPTGGEIVYNGQNILETKDIPAYRAKVEMVFQSFNLFENMTVLKNCVIGQRKVLKTDKETAKKRAMGCLDKVGMLPYINAKPKQLSGGQKQRVAIARALATKPDVILFDEPTSALDPISTSKIEDLAMELKKDYTIVMVTHNMQQAVRVSDNTAFFLLGEVVEYNNTEKLFSIPQNKKTEDYITGRFG